MRTYRAAGIMLLAMAVGGCGSESNLAEVTGTVTLDGKAVQSGGIKFTPVDGKTPTTGGEIVDGEYSAPVHLGTMKVSINVPKTVGEKPIYGPGSKMMPINVEAAPPRYNRNTELKLDVIPGRNEKNWELSSKQD